MGKETAPGPQEQRFAAYIEGLAEAAGHADRHAPLKSYCTGLLLPGERSVFELNSEIEESLAGVRRAFWEKTPQSEALAAVRTTIGVRKLAEIPASKMLEAGRVDPITGTQFRR